MERLYQAVAAVCHLCQMKHVGPSAVAAPWEIRKQLKILDGNIIMVKGRFAASGRRYPILRKHGSLEFHSLESG